MDIRAWHGGKIVLLWLTGILAGFVVFVAIMLVEWASPELLLFIWSAELIALWAMTWHWLSGKEQPVPVTEDIRSREEEDLKLDERCADEYDERRELEKLMEMASDWSSHFAEYRSLEHLADEDWNREYPMWRMRHPPAALAWDKTGEENVEYKESLGSDLGEDERDKLAGEDMARRWKAWSQEYPEAHQAYQAMSETVYREDIRFEAIANMPEMIEARYRDRPESMPGRVGERYHAKLRREALREDPKALEEAEQAHRAVNEALGAAFAPLDGVDRSFSIWSKASESTAALVEWPFLELRSESGGFRAGFVGDPGGLSGWERDQWIRLCGKAGFDPEARTSADLPRLE